VEYPFLLWRRSAPARHHDESAGSVEPLNRNDIQQIGVTTSDLFLAFELPKMFQIIKAGHGKYEHAVKRKDLNEFPVILDEFEARRNDRIIRV
jgi:hypothetical protein